MCPRFWFFEILVSIKSVLDPDWVHYRRRPHRLLLRSGLAHLLLQSFARVPHTLVLVGIGRPQRAHFRCHLADLLAVDSAKRDLRLLGIDGGIDAGWQRVLDGMRISQAEHHRP